MPTQKTIPLKQRLLGVCWRLGLFHVTRFLTRKRLNILCYHGFQLQDECAFRPRLFISKEKFAERLDFIARHGFSVLPLGEALQRLRAGTLPPSSVAITIDDGFYSVGSVAAPLLQAHRFPATLYLTTYYVQKARPMYRMLIQYLFWKSRATAFDRTGFDWLGHGVIDMRERETYWEVVWAIIFHGERHCSEPERRELAKAVGAKLGLDAEAIAESRMMSLMTTDEARQFAAAGFDVELHTHRHRFPADDETIARQEIAENRDAIRAITGKAAQHFCYPSGHWDARHWAWLQAMQVTSATTCMPGFNTRATPPFALTRFLDSENISAIEFVAEMYGFAEVIRSIQKLFRLPRAKPFFR